MKGQYFNLFYRKLRNKIFLSGMQAGPTSAAARMRIVLQWVNLADLTPPLPVTLEKL